MPLDYSNSNNSNLGLISFLIPQKSYAAEQALSDRKLQFMALQASQAQIDQQQNARAIAELEAQTTKIQELPFLGADKSKITKWLDSYQKKIKEKVKIDYSDNPTDFIKSEGAFAAQKLISDFTSSQVFDVATRNRVQVGLGLEAQKKNERLIGSKTEEGYKTGMMKLNEFLSGKADTYEFEGSYKVDPNKAVKYFGDQTPDFDANDLAVDKDGNLVRDANGRVQVDFTRRNPYTGFKVPESKVEEYFLNELGDEAALQDLKYTNPQLFKSMSYSNDRNKAFDYIKNLSDQNYKALEMGWKAQDQKMQVGKNARDIAKDNMSLALGQQKLDKGNKENEEGSLLFEETAGPAISAKNIDVFFNGRETTTAAKASDLAKNGVIQFQKLNNLDPYALEKENIIDKSGDGRYKFRNASTNIIVPGIGDIRATKKDYEIVELGNILTDETGQAWVNGRVEVSKAVYDAIKAKYPNEASSEFIKRNYKTKATKDKESEPRVRYEVPFYTPFNFRPSAKASFVNKGAAQDKKMEQSNTTPDDLYSDF